MIDATRSELLKLIEEMSAACPDYRFGQMVLNLAFLAAEDGDQRLWDLEDRELIAAARKHLKDWYARAAAAEHASQHDPAMSNS